MNLRGSNRQRSQVPPRKPAEERKQALTVTLEPGHRHWLRENYRALGFRSESHAVDEAIRLLIAQSNRPARRLSSSESSEARESL